MDQARKIAWRQTNMEGSKRDKDKIIQKGQRTPKKRLDKTWCLYRLELRQPVQFLWTSAIIFTYFFSRIIPGQCNLWPSTTETCSLESLSPSDNWVEEIPSSSLDISHSRAQKHVFFRAVKVSALIYAINGAAINAIKYFNAVNATLFTSGVRCPLTRNRRVPT